MSAQELIAQLLAGDPERELRLRVDPDDAELVVAELVQVRWDDDEERDVVMVLSAMSAADPVVALLRLSDGASA